MHIFRYRLAVIQTNIDYCFGDKLSKEERKIIVNKFYKNFIDILLESFKGLSMKPEHLVKRFKLQNPELINRHFSEGQHVIVYSQHYNNWEWGPITLGIQMQHHIVGAVKLISNHYINNFMIRGRSKTNVSVIPSNQTHHFFKDLPTKEKPQAIVFIADQNPHGSEKTTTINFLGKDTNFHNGAAHYAAQSQFPIYTLDVYRIGRGQYKVLAHQLSDGKENLDPEEITQKYANHLADLIHLAPEAWLWSHKRFKKNLSY